MEGMEGMEGAWRGYHLHITGGGKHVQVAAEIICLDCCSYNKLYVLTSGCLNGGEKVPEQVRLIMMAATWPVKKYGGGER